MAKTFLVPFEVYQKERKQSMIVRSNTA